MSIRERSSLIKTDHLLVATLAAMLRRSLEAHALVQSPCDGEDNCSVQQTGVAAPVQALETVPAPTGHPRPPRGQSRPQALPREGQEHPHAETALPQCPEPDKPLSSLP